MKNTILEYEQQAQEDMKKLKRVILSCETKEQLRNSWKYFLLWKKKYSHYIDILVDSGFLYREGEATGIFIGMLKDEIYGKRTIPSLEK